MTTSHDGDVYVALAFAGHFSFFACAFQHCLLMAPIPLRLELELVLKAEMMNLYHRPVPNYSVETTAP